MGGVAEGKEGAWRGVEAWGLESMESIGGGASGAFSSSVSPGKTYRPLDSSQMGLLESEPRCTSFGGRFQNPKILPKRPLPAFGSAAAPPSGLGGGAAPDLGCSAAPRDGGICGIETERGCMEAGF